MFGYYCGLRVGEVFGLRWSDIDWNKSTIKIRRQMNYESSSYCLGTVKTLAGYREVTMPDVLRNHLEEKFCAYKKSLDLRSYRNTERVIDKTRVRDGRELIGGDFINRKENGELLTINSVKFYSKLIKEKTSVKDFKFHSLRKTNLTELAALGTPAHILMQHAGHKKITTTNKYYLGNDDVSQSMLVRNLNALGTAEPEIEMTDNTGRTKVIKESDYIEMLKLRAQIPTIKEQTAPYTVRTLPLAV